MKNAIALAASARRAGLASNFAEGHAILDEAETFAGEDALARAWCAIERGRLHNTAGDPGRALPFFETSWDLARAVGAHDLAVDAAHMLAIAAPLDDAIRWTAIALDYIGTHPEVGHWRGPLHNNIGWHYFEAGRFEEALGSFRKGVQVREGGGSRELRIARYAVIRTLRALGRVAEATELAEEVVAIADAAGEAAPFVHEELAHCHAKSDPERSRTFALRALAVLEANAQLVRDEPARLADLRQLAGA